MRQGNDLELVTAPNDDDEIGQNCKEKRVLRAIALTPPINQSILNWIVLVITLYSGDIGG
ncbi:MAG: hypothetical protein WC966_11970 [Bradymonadales bacterium]